MLTMPADASPLIPVIGIDPGSVNLGVGVIWYNVDTCNIDATEAKTYNGERMGRGSWITERSGDRAGRIAAHRDNLLRIFNIVQPAVIASESPFFNQRRPQAYGALTEVVCAIREAVQLHDSWKHLQLIDPPTVKNAVGAKGNAGKEEVKEKLLGLSHINYQGDVPLAMLDEHSIDAIAVAYCQLRRLMEQLCLPKPRWWDGQSLRPL